MNGLSKCNQRENFRNFLMFFTVTQSLVKGYFSALCPKHYHHQNWVGDVVNMNTDPQREGNVKRASPLPVSSMPTCLPPAPDVRDVVHCRPRSTVDKGTRNQDLGACGPSCHAKCDQTLKLTLERKSKFKTHFKSP